MNATVNKVLEVCRMRLQAYYGDRFVELLLYGSVARGDDTPDSDVDLLVVLRGPYDHFREQRAIIDILYGLELEHNVLLSAKPALLDDVRRGATGLYRNALAEGIRV